MIHESRIHALNNHSEKNGSYILYWMQQSQRAHYNHALEYAVDLANNRKIPVRVYFGITGNYPEAEERHYHFMLQGLSETKKRCKERGIKMLIRHEDPAAGIIRESAQAAAVVFDRGYLHHQRQWRSDAAAKIQCPVFEVESDSIIPVETISPKEEYSAATIRRKIEKILPSFLVPLYEREVIVREKAETGSLSIDDIDISRKVKKLKHISGGYSAAHARLTDFLKNKLKYYDTLRNDPAQNFSSGLSPYLHFGQISSLECALSASQSSYSAVDKFLDELIVRRELSHNFVYYNKNYSSFACLPDWIKKTFDQHRHDKRPYLYTLDELENAATHDIYWNTAQKELTACGTMQSYMRMYWGKKIIEWSPSPETAYEIMVRLNNRYALDGRDPNSYAGIAWCFGKHDRPWKERDIFGKVRYMNDRGLERKFDMKKYIELVENKI